jgi:hypothetical protein
MFTVVFMVDSNLITIFYSTFYLVLILSSMSNAICHLKPWNLRFEMWKKNISWVCVILSNMKQCWWHLFTKRRTINTNQLALRSTIHFRRTINTNQLAFRSTVHFRRTINTNQLALRSTVHFRRTINTNQLALRSTVHFITDNTY